MIHSTIRPKTTPDDWSRANRVYSAATGRPGPRDPALTPFMVDFTRAFDVAYQLEKYGRQFGAGVLACGSQMGKTEAVLDIIGWSFDQRPAPMMYVGPTKDFLRDEIEPRIEAMLTGTKSLRERLPTGKQKRQFRKVIGGVPLRLVWAQSAASLRAMAAKIALVDELDAIPDDVQQNGDPFSLLEARGFSFAERMRGAISTPLLGTVDTYRDEGSGLEFWQRMDGEDVHSQIWKQFQAGTMHQWAWPCPACHVYFIPRFKDLYIDPEASPARAQREAHVICPNCGGVIEEDHKPDLNARGRYVAPGQSVDKDGNVTGPLPDVTMLSFWVSGLASPFVTFGDRAKAYAEAKLSREEAKIQSVMNTGFGELYSPGGGDIPEWQEVAALKAPYRKGELPPGCRLLTLAVDVQGNRLVYTIRGWGAYGTSWLIDFGEIFGRTSEQEVWNKLATLLTTPIGGLAIRAAFVDSGFRPGKPVNVPTNKVYAFCRKFPRRAWPTKGKAKQDKPLILGKNDVKATGDVKKYGLDLIWLDTDYCKSWVHERIRWDPTEPGAWCLPEDVTDDYCKQIVSEARVRKPSGAPEWVPKSRNNHFLDCEGMQAGLGHMLSVHLMRDRDGDVPNPVLPPSRKAARAVQRPAQQATIKTPPAASAPMKPAKSNETQQSARAERRKRLDELRARLYGGR